MDKKIVNEIKRPYELKMDEWFNFEEWLKDNIAIEDKGHLRNKNHMMYLLEPYNIRPNSWKYEIMKQYKGIITWNKKLVVKYPDIFFEVLPGQPRWNGNNYLDRYKAYEEKLEWNSYFKIYVPVKYIKKAQQKIPIYTERIDFEWYGFDIGITKLRMATCYEPKSDTLYIRECIHYIPPGI